MRVLAIGGANLRRMLRDRSNIFFVFVLPLAIILLVGAQFGGGGPGTVLAVTAGDGALARSVVDVLSETDGIDVEMMEDRQAVIEAVERARVSGGLDIPTDFDAQIASGSTPSVGFVTRPQGLGALQPIVESAIARATTAPRVARLLSAEIDRPYDEALAVVDTVEVTGVGVRTETVGEGLFPTGTGQFSVGAAQQLVLFVFLTALTGSAAMIQSRQLGVTRRMLSTPTTPTTVVAGEGMGRFSVAIVQGLYIVGVTWVAFGVDWGDLLGAAALLVALSATGAGAAMLFGTLFRNDQQAGGFSVMAGLGLGALGGCMLPLELFSPTLNRVAHLTPHAWAIDGFAKVVYRNGSLVDVLPEVGVLLAFAVVLLGVSGWRLHSVITR